MWIAHSFLRRIQTRAEAESWWVVVGGGHSPWAKKHNKFLSRGKNIINWGKKILNFVKGIFFAKTLGVFVFNFKTLNDCSVQISVMGWLYIFNRNRKFAFVGGQEWVDYAEIMPCRSLRIDQNRWTMTRTPNKMSISTYRSFSDVPIACLPSLINSLQSMRGCWVQ